jgi:hypothetical protein
VASAGDAPCPKRTTQSGKLSGKRGCRLLITRQAECYTRPDLWLWGGAPRRNRTGDPILTIDGRPVRGTTRHLAPLYRTASGRPSRRQRNEEPRGGTRRGCWQITGTHADHSWAWQGPGSSHARQPPTAQGCWCEQSLQGRLGGSSSQYACVGSSGRPGGMSSRTCLQPSGGTASGRLGYTAGGLLGCPHAQLCVFFVCVAAATEWPSS